MIRHPKDFYSGVLFIAFGVAALVIGSNYALGTAARMGPGYFPRILGILLVRSAPYSRCARCGCREARYPRFGMAPYVDRIGSVVIFGFIDRAGLFLSTVGLILGASVASHEFRWKEALASGIFFAVLAILVFVLGLKLQLPIWPPIFSSN